MKSKAPEKVSIPECPAYEKCRAIGADCEVCLQLSVADWRAHVKKVLAKG